MGSQVAEALRSVLSARRDVRRFRADPVPEELLCSVLAAGHLAPSVGHSQPWRFIVVRGASARAKAAWMADRARMAQAAAMDPESARLLLDLDLEGIREAPVGVVVCCDRRVPPAGVLGRATFEDADLWSCACAIENIWLAARAEGLGMGWVTLFQPQDLASLVGAPPGVETLGWLCLGWPDERPPAPGLERRGWSKRLPLAEVVFFETWPEAGVGPPPSHLDTDAGALPSQVEVVAGHDSADRLLTPSGSLGSLDRALDRLVALGADRSWFDRAALVVAMADHPVAALGVTAFSSEVTSTVAAATLAGKSLGATAARAAGLELLVVDAGVAWPMGQVDQKPVAGFRQARPCRPRGDLETGPALHPADAFDLFHSGRVLAEEEIGSGRRILVLGEVGVGNTTVAAALASALVGGDGTPLVGLGAGSDSQILQRKGQVVSQALARVGPQSWLADGDWLTPLCELGGPEIAILAGVCYGASQCKAAVVLDGLATSVAALVAVVADPAVAFHLIAGQRSREVAHKAVLDALGLEPLLDLRLRAGEGVGAALAFSLLRQGLDVRLQSARTC